MLRHKKTRLLIDDERSLREDRHYETVVARDVRSAIDELYSLEHIDELWLDHDLSDGEDIWPVIDVIEEEGFIRDKIDTIVIHTGNPVGREYMAHVLGFYFDDIRHRIGTR